MYLKRKVSLVPKLSIEQFNQLPVSQLNAKLTAICHCQRWVDAMLEIMPFISPQAFKIYLLTYWLEMGEVEVLEAFSGHARIGDIDAIKAKYATATEQGQVLMSSDDTIKQLANYNTLYENRFGFIFIVCATGLTAESMLALLKERIDNTRDVELAIATQEQQKIMLLRADKLFEGTL